MRGKCQAFVLYRQTWQCNENITDYGGKRAVVLPTGCPCSAGLLAGICRTKAKVPAIPRGWGGGAWLQMTSALQLNSTVKPMFSDHIKRELFLAFQTDVCLLLYDSSLYYSNPAISNYLSENPKYVLFYMVA